MSIVASNDACTTNKTLDCPVNGTLSLLNNSNTYLSATVALVNSSKLAPKVGCQFFGTLTLTAANLNGLATHAVGFYLSDDNTKDVNDPLLLQLDAAKIAKAFAGNKPVKLKFKLPKGVCPTGTFLIVVVDDATKKAPSGSVTESDETNNIAVYGPLP